MHLSKAWLLLVLFGMGVAGFDSFQESALNNNSQKIEVLFLGHAGEHHNSGEYMPILARALADDGINITYTESPDDLNSENLAGYDALLLYANHDEITPSQEQALLDFVSRGNGFIPIHSASYCFRNSDAFVELVGARFQRHGTGTFTADIVDDGHPVTRGLEEFETWDETYVHTMHNPDRTVLMERVDEEGAEPWTWVRTHGEGRVFYTAYGHDERTWSHPGFQELVKNGIVWAVNSGVRSEWESLVSTLPVLQYEERATIPNYEERDPAPKFQLPLTPEESMKTLQVPVGYEIQLFAAEPDVINPIDMAWDERGRLWVIETVDYPNTVREDDGVGNDRIKILEDTDGDGRADEITVFAENLNIPTGMVFVNGGVVVSQAPHFLFLRDTDGDDRADVREQIMSGWGTYDTHAGPSNLTYGFDNRIWGTVGYSGFEGVMNGDTLDFGNGFFRFNPENVQDNPELEFLAQTSNNTWGLGFNETFDVFGSTANNTHAVYMGIPKRYFEHYQWPDSVDNRQRRSAGQAKIDGHYAMHPITPNFRQVDVFGGFTAAAGFQFYTARQFPEEYWNRIAFVSEPTGGLVHRAVIEENGAGYSESNGWNIFAGYDEWVSPVAAKVGPDGSLWVLDWYNFIIQHNPTPRPDRGGFDAENGEGNAHVNPLRDRSHGRIYRITYSETGPSGPMSLSAEEPEELVAALGNSNMFWRMTAQRLLVERGETDLLPDLYELVNNTGVDELGLNTAAQHALWTIHGLGALDGENEEALEVATGALQHPAAGVRKSAVNVLPGTNTDAVEAILESGILQDRDPHTRLAAILSTIDMEPSRSVGQRLSELEVPDDEWLRQALRLATQHHGSASAMRLDNRSGRSGESEAVASDTLEIQIRAVAEQMEYDVTGFTVRPGQTVRIEFLNPDYMQHNLLILAPGSLERVGAAADELATSMEGAEKDYVPDLPEVLYSTPMLNPEESYTLTFTAPEEPGSYPYVCTFPAHWRLMQGTMTVAGPNRASSL